MIPGWRFWTGLFVALGLIGLVAALVIGSGQWAEPPVVAAVVAVVGTLITALSGVMLWTAQERRRDREKEDERRAAALDAAAAAERLRRKLAIALRSEIAVSLERLRDYYDPARYMEQVAAYGRNIDGAKPGERGMPVGKALPERLVYETHQRDIYELPEPVIRALVRYYQNDLGLAALVTAMADGTYDAVDRPRQKQAVALYFSLGEATLRAAIEAKALLDGFIDGGADLLEDARNTEELGLLKERVSPERAANRSAAILARLGPSEHDG